MYRRIAVTPAQIAAFARRWPCSGLPDDIGLTLEFDPAGNLVALDWEDGSDQWEAETSGALVALVHDAQTGALA